MRKINTGTVCRYSFRKRSILYTFQKAGSQGIQRNYGFYIHESVFLGEGYKLNVLETRLGKYLDLQEMK
jgi:hypothetical protein